MIFPKEFIDLLLKFAQKLAVLNGLILEESLFRYTCLPVRIGLGFSELYKDNPKWMDFVASIDGEFTLDKVYDYYLKHTKDNEFRRKQYGCFSYDWDENNNMIRMHFANNDKSSAGVLSDERQAVRMEELKEMFSEIRVKHPTAKRVASASWLFNIDSFKRLFPKEFFLNLKEKIDYYSLGIWGQFIDKDGAIKADIAETFMKAINKANSMNEVAQSFPLKNISLESDIGYFYSFYNVNN